jgi:hypothetical protein
MSVRNKLPAQHLDSETKDIVLVVIALVGTMSALVLGLLISSAKATYDTRRNQLLQVSADIILLDSTLAHYGPETKEARSMLRQDTAAALEQFWPTNGRQPMITDRRSSSIEAVFDKIQRLTPQNDVQHSLQSQAETIAFDLGRTRVLLFEQLGSSIPIPFLVVLVFWLFVIFTSFGLFAPRYGTVIAAFFVSALSVSAALFLILELDRSFEGLLQVSSTPLRAALAQVGE